MTLSTVVPLRRLRDVFVSDRSMNLAKWKLDHLSKNAQEAGSKNKNPLA